MNLTAEQLADLERIAASAAHSERDGASATADIPETMIVTAEEFVAVDEPGAEALVGGEDDALIPEGGDVMFYGDGGAGKTTLSVDLACHLGAGQDWLGLRVSRAVRVLLIEGEGPRALFRKKLRRKLVAWTGRVLDGRVAVFQEPWGQFSFANASWREQLAIKINENEIDVLIAGPLTRLGMDEAGTLQQVRDFMALIADVRTRSGRRLTVCLIHHENKGGTVSGAWEGAGDTLLHVEDRGHGNTALHVQKARWSSAHHKITLELVWTDGEGFALKDERNMLAEILDLLADGTPRTIDEMGEQLEAGTKAVRDIVEIEHPDRFILLTGEQAKAVGRRPNTKLYQVAP